MMRASNNFPCLLKYGLRVRSDWRPKQTTGRSFQIQPYPDDPIQPPASMNSELISSSNDGLTLIHIYCYITVVHRVIHPAR